jgi:hypothetical protein
MHEKKNILKILKETEIAMRKKDGLRLKQLSDKTNHTATVYQDADNIILAVLVYSIGKIVERENYRSMDGWNFFVDNLTKNLKIARKALEKEDLESFRESLGQIRNSINKIDGSLKNYISDVFYKAEINRAFKYYEYGLSSQKTAELLGISLWDLSSYIGQSNISEARVSESIPVKERIETMEEFFK